MVALNYSPTYLFHQHIAICPTSMIMCLTEAHGFRTHIVPLAINYDLDIHFMPFTFHENFVLVNQFF